jgi:hypothetical protein
MTSELDFFTQRGFGLTIGFGHRPAVLVIDMIRAFTNPDTMLGANLDAQIEATQNLLSIARARSIPVIFSTVSYDDVDLKDAGIWALKQRGVMDLRTGTPEVELDQRLQRMPSEGWLVKKYASCFFWHRSKLATVIPRDRYFADRRVHYERLRACYCSRCFANRVSSNGRPRMRR